MKRKIIITDLTRFTNPDEVCTAGYDMSTKELIRPWPYIKREKCDQLKILPGAIIEGEFTKKPDRTPPHVEDHNQDKMTYNGDDGRFSIGSAILCISLGDELDSKHYKLVASVIIE